MTDYRFQFPILVVLLNHTLALPLVQNRIIPLHLGHTQSRNQNDFECKELLV